MQNLTYLFAFVAIVSLMLVFVALRWTRSRLARVQRDNPDEVRVCIRIR